MESARSGSPEEGWGGMGVSAPVSSCMHEEQKTERERKKRWPAQTFTTRKWNWKEFAKCFSFSLKVVVTGFVVIIFTC